MAQHEILRRYQTGTGNSLWHCCSLPPQLNLFWTQLGWLFGGAVLHECGIYCIQVNDYFIPCLLLYLTLASWQTYTFTESTDSLSSTPLHPVIPEHWNQHHKIKMLWVIHSECGALHTIPRLMQIIGEDLFDHLSSIPAPPAWSHWLCQLFHPCFR